MSLRALTFRLFDLTLASSYNSAFITAHGGTVAQAEADLIAGLLGGQTYLNIHTNLFPGGEIRANLLRHIDLLTTVSCNVELPRWISARQLAYSSEGFTCTRKASLCCGQPLFPVDTERKCN